MLKQTKINCIKLLQGSLSRALGLRPRGDKASPTSSLDNGGNVTSSQHNIYALAANGSPPPPQLPPRPATISASSRRHRRVKSIGDIDYLCGGGGGAGNGPMPNTISTAVWQEASGFRRGGPAIAVAAPIVPSRSMSERGYCSSSASSQASYYSFNGACSKDFRRSFQSPSKSSCYSLRDGYYSPQSEGRPFSDAHRYASLAEETWSSANKDDRNKRSSYKSDRIIWNSVGRS